MTRESAERKETEKALQASEARFRTVIEQSPLAIHVFAPDGRSLRANDSWKELWNLKEGEAEGTNIFEDEQLCAAGLTPYVEDSVSDSRPINSPPLLYEPTQIGREGSPRWLRAYIYPVRDETGSVTEMALLLEDVTEHKRSEEALRKSEKNLAEAQRMARLGSWEWEVKTGEVTWSDEVFRVYGYEPQEFVPTLEKLMEVVHPDDRESVEQMVYAALHEGEPYDFEHRIVRPDGEERVVHRQAEVLFDEEGEPLRMVGTIHDVTEQKKAEEALRESEERYRAVMEQSAEAIWLFDPGTKEVLESNTSFQALLGYTAEELSGMTNYDFVAHSDEEVNAAVDRKVQKGRTSPAERRYRRKDGTLLYVEVNGTMISYHGKEVVCSVARDLTERKEAEEALKESEERFRSAFEDSPIGVAMVDLDRRYFRVNRALCEMLGYSEEELLGKTTEEVLHPEDLELSAYYIDTTLEKGEGSYTLERRYVRADERLVWSLSSISLIQDSQGDPSHFVCLHQDITERKALEERLEHQAFYDFLTDLPNRALFLDRLKHALTGASRDGGGSVGVLLVDLDDFKAINDSLGHEVGNTLLVDVAERLEGSVRSGDTVARLFGDEFAVLLEEPAGVEEACRAAERVAECLHEPFSLEGREMYVSSSIGIAFGETVEDRPEEVLRHADLAMYVAKSRGKDQYQVYNPSIEHQVATRVDLESDLRKAIEREEFEVHYQPVIDLHTEQITGFEALARWRHPERGLLAAEEFIRVAEETGLIRPLGCLVLEEACRQAKKWGQRYPDKTLSMSVNFSASQFSHQADLIPEVLSDVGLDPSSLHLEITERVVMDDAEYSIRALNTLKGQGISLLIDDFGMGYSCLYFLKRMPVDGLKIDRAFIAGLGEDPGDEAIVAGTIGLAHALGLNVVGEGVETADQLSRLKELGCDLAQGYYLAQPLPSDAAERLLFEATSR